MATLFFSFLRSRLLWACGAAALALAACGGGGGGGSEPTGGTGTLRLALTDAPACGYDAVNVTIERIRVHQSDGAGDDDAGWHDLVISPRQRVDLLSLTNGVLKELGEMTLPTGRYTHMRLVLADNGNSAPFANSVVPTGGSEVALTTPSAQQSGLKLNNLNIEVGPNQIADVVLDFDACKSIVKRGNSGHYNLKPVIAAIPRIIDVGRIEGYVHPSIAAGTTVSVQSAGNPVKATPPDADTGKFVLYPVPVGSYTLVLTNATRATAAVTGVPVVAAAAPTIVGAASAPLLPPAAASAPRVVTGTVETTPTASASVRALQTLATVPTPTRIEVGWVAADDLDGSFSLALPLAAPVIAPYAPTPPALTFSTDDSAAGKYTLQAESGGVAKNQAVDVNEPVPPLSFIFP